MQLNPRFLERMKNLLGEQYDEYLKYISRPAFRGLRVNTLKCDVDTLNSVLGYELSPAPFSTDVYYLPEKADRLGNHPLHHAGGFYLGDPSATSAVTALDIQPGDTVLDLCASPGGKTVGIACALQGTGFIIANETVSGRVTPLLSNIERMGITNIAVTNARPDELCPSLKGTFDKVLVDVPCSGEGMMLRDGAANENWSEKNIEACAQRQQRILDGAAMCVKDGGVLVYSTCTFAPEENELTVEAFLKSHPEFKLDDIKADFGVSAFARLCNTPEIEKCRRIFPMQGGDGHFAARMVKSGECTVPQFPEATGKNAVFEQFWKDTFNGNTPRYTVHNDKVFICPYDLKTIPHLIREGVFAGHIKGNRFEPAHPLFSAVGFDAKNTLFLKTHDPYTHDFLLGLEIPCDCKGYTAVKINGMPLSFGKASGGRLKNHYPKGLRLLK